MAAANKEQITKYRALASEAKDSCPDYPQYRFSGKGIVICAGGQRYFTNAWVAMRMVRHWGCNLPIEFWHLGASEIDDTMRELVKPYNVTCVDAYEVRKDYPARRLFGWELNPYSIIHSSFEEVIFLDADNVALINPEILFDTPQYKQTGAIFWPDYGRLAKTRQIWEICDVEHRDEPEFESGQIVVDKRRCWKELNLTMHINEHSDFYYTHIHGDKDTFHMAWHMYDTPYSMPSKPIHPLRSTMCQHDFDNKRIFQHRNMQKWEFSGRNSKINGFLEENTCLEYLEDLRKKWNGKVNYPSPLSEEGKKALRDVSGKIFNYHRLGYDNRDLELKSDFSIGKGAAKLESNWYIDDSTGSPVLHILGGSITCRLTRNEGEDKWTGKWENHERMPIELTLVSRSPATVKKDPVIKDIASADSFEKEVSLKVEGRRFIYIRVGYDKRVLSLDKGGVIGEGSMSVERVWSSKMIDGKEVISIGPSHSNPICTLFKERDGVWRGEWNRFEKMPIHLVEIP